MQAPWSVQAQSNRFPFFFCNSPLRFVFLLSVLHIPVGAVLNVNKGSLKALPMLKLLFI